MVWSLSDLVTTALMRALHSPVYLSKRQRILLEATFKAFKLILRAVPEFRFQGLLTARSQEEHAKLLHSEVFIAFIPMVTSLHNISLSVNHKMHLLVLSLTVLTKISKVR